MYSYSGKFGPVICRHNGGGGSGKANRVGGASGQTKKYLEKHRQFTEKAFSAQFSGTVNLLLSLAPEPIQKMFGIFADMFKYGGDPSNYGRYGIDEAFYVPSNGTVYFNENYVADGDTIHDPYNTYFHEFAHNIDDKFRVAVYQLLQSPDRIRAEKYGITNISQAKSARMLFNDELGRALQTDVRNKVNAKIAEHGGKISDTQAARFVIDDLRAKYGFSYSAADITTRRGLADLSDMMQAGFETIRGNGTMISPGKGLGAGHQRGYFVSQGGNANAAGVEAFAEITAAYVASPLSQHIIETEMPNTFAAYNKVVSAVVDILDV